MKLGKRAEFKKKSGRYEKKKTRVIEKYSILMLIATLLMSIGYAELTPVAMSVTADITAEAQEGVFITNIVATGNSGANMSASKVNSYISSRMDTTVVLGSAQNSTLTYTVSLMNRYDTEQVFVGTFWTQDAGGKYDNTKITYDVSMQEGVTTIQPGQSMNFTITFKYAGSDVSNKKLNSLLNFRFEEAPKIEFSPATTPINLSNIYPDYTPVAQTFTVKSVAGNGVPVKYTLSATVQKPFKAVIYDSSSAEVASGTEITMIPNANKAEIVHTYTMKIFWDSTNAESGTVYNDYTYAGKTFTGTVNLNAIPLDKTNTSVVDSKYNGLTIAKTGNIGITTAPMYLSATAEATSVELSSGAIMVYINAKNNDGTNYNPYKTQLKISTDGNWIIRRVNNQNLNNTTMNIQMPAQKTDVRYGLTLVPNGGVTLGASQTFSITVQAVGPYANKPADTITITAKDTTAPTKPTITGGNTNTTYAKSVTISVSTPSTDGGSGVAYYEYYKSSSSTAPTANTAGIQLGG